MFYIPQISQNDCGYACLKMLLAQIHKDENYLYLPYKEKNRPFSYQTLLALAQVHHSELVGFRVEDPEEIRKNKVFPLIVSLKSEGDTNHAVLVTKVKKHFIKILDPDKGTYELSLKRFYELWDQTGLLIKNYQKTPCPFVVKEKRKKADYIVGIICQVMSAICCIAGLFFIDEDVYVFIPVALFICFAVFELLLRGHLFKFMRQMDEKTFEEIKLDKKDYRSFHTRFEEYKKAILVTPLNTIFTFLISAFLIFIVVINDLRNLMMVMMPICFSLIEVYFLHPNEREKQHEIMRDEEELFQAENIDDFKEKEEEIHAKTYRLAKRVLIKKYVGISLMLLGTIIVMAVSHVVSVPYIVFYLCIEYTLFTNLTNLFTYDERKREYLQAKVRFINVLHQNDEII